MKRKRHSTSRLSAFERIDAIVAVNTGASVSYVKLVRLNPGKYQSALAAKITADLKRVEAEFKRFTQRALTAA